MPTSTAAAEIRVSVRFNAEGIKKLDALVTDRKKRHAVMHTAAGRGWEPSRAGVLSSLVDDDYLRLQNGKPGRDPRHDPRQADLMEVLEQRSELAPRVDALARKSKSLARKLEPKKPRPAHRPKRRSATKKRPPRGRKPATGRRPSKAKAAKRKVRK